MAAVRRTDLDGLLTVEPRHQTDEPLDVVSRCGALLQGHFALQGGAHSRYFIRFAQIGRVRAELARVAAMLVSSASFARGSTVVLCPESAGFFLGNAIATTLEIRKTIARIDMRRRPLDVILSGTLTPNDRVIVVNDIVTTGQSLLKLLSLVRTHAAAVAGVVVFGTLAAPRFRQFLEEESIEATWLVNADWPKVQSSACPQCELGQDLFLASEFN